MRAHSALFHRDGDQLRTRGGVGPVAAIVRLLEPLDDAYPPAPRRADEGVPAV